MPKLRRNASKSAKKERVHTELSKFKVGTLKSSSGQKVTSKKQAVAIALSEAGQSKKKRKNPTPRPHPRKSSDRTSRNKGRR